MAGRTIGAPTDTSVLQLGGSRAATPAWPIEAERDGLLVFRSVFDDGPDGHSISLARGSPALIAPRAAVPIHWGTLYPRYLHRVWHRPLREPGDRFAAYARQLAPDVVVRVLRPGETTTFDFS